MNLKEMIRELADKGVTNLGGVICTVESVDRSMYQCDLLPVDGSAKIIGARLTATAGENNTIVLIPTEGSYVIVSQINDNDAWIAMCTEVDEVIVANHTDISVINEGDITVENGGDVIMNAGKQAVLKNAQTTLKDILNDLNEALQNAVIMTPAGPGNFDPATVTKFVQVDTLVNQLFKE